MSYRLPAYLHRNRHGVLYFRLCVPSDLQCMVGQREIYRSLNTANVRQAAYAAQTLIVAFRAFFRELGGGSVSEKEIAAKGVSDALASLLQRIDEAPTNMVGEVDLNGLGAVTALARKMLQQRDKQDELAEEVWRLNQVRCEQEKRHKRDLELVKQVKGLTEPVKPTGGKTIMEVWEEFKAVQVAKGAQGDMRGGWKNPGRVSVEQLPHIRSFVEFIGGDRPIAEVTAKQVIDFREYVMTTSDIGSSGVRKQRLNRSGAVFKYAASKLDIDDDFAAYFKFTGQIKKNPYQKFDRDDLIALFESETYRECRFETSSEYWLPLLGLFTGARLNELCQLLKSDIGRHEGIDTILIIDDEESKRLKTDNSRRIVPIHSKLIELGFLDFVRSAPDGRVFPHLREDPNKPGDYGQRATEDFTEYRRSVGVGSQAGEGKSRKAFHSFRSTFIDAMRKAKPPVPKDRRTRLVGHEYEDTHDDTYNGGDAMTMFSADTLKGDVESVRFDVRFTPYRPA